MLENISVIIPTFNRAQFLTRAINSALIQLTQDDEIIIVDDGSTDNTEQVIRRFLSKNIRYIKTTNKGAGAARNRGVAEASKPLIGFVDSDDEWMPGKIRIQRSFMRAKPDILFCFSNFGFWNKRGIEERFSLKSWNDDKREWSEILGEGIAYSSVVELPDGMKDFLFYEGDLSLPSLSAHYMNINTLLVRRKEAGDALRFAEDTKTYEEWECLGRLACLGKCAYFDCETAWQHAHFGPRLTDATGLDLISAKVNIIERVWGKEDNFLILHKDVYNNILNEQRLFKIGALIFNGFTKLARKEIDNIPNCPLAYRFLARLPGFAAKPLSNILRKIRHTVIE